MEMPPAKLRQDYTDEIKVIEANIKDIASGTAPQELYDYSQTKLDKLAERFQYDEHIGAARYKLYELQALLYYFQNRDDDALAFIQQAIEIKGASYKRAEQLMEQLQSEPSTMPAQVEHVVAEEHLTKEEKKKRLIGVDGWLAWYVVGLFIGTAMTLYNFFSSGVGLASSDVNSLNNYKPGLGDTFHALTTFENVAMIIYAILLVVAIILILRRSKAAKAVAVVGLAFGAIYAITDYSIASSLFDSSGLTKYVQTELSSAAGTAGRDAVAALIWIPYFIKSKRVKATLTK